MTLNGGFYFDNLVASERDKNQCIIYDEYLHGGPNVESKRMEYGPGQANVIHYGQLKLYAANLQFMNDMWDPDKIPNPILVYVGAAPCSWALFFREMFPDVELHLYDPAPFDVTLCQYDSNNVRATKDKNSDKSPIFLYKRLFLDEDTERWKAVSERVLFVSDIRPLSYSEGNFDEVHEDQVRQMNWVKDINPVAAQLKLQMPYDGTKEYSSGGTYKYLDGTIKYQTFVARSSSETRLVCSRPYNTRDWDWDWYNETLSYHNHNVRNKEQFKNQFDMSSCKYTLLPYYGLYNDWDSTMLIRLLINYLRDDMSEEAPTESDVANLFMKLEDFMELMNFRQRKAKNINYKRKRLKDRRKNDIGK